MEIFLGLGSNVGNREDNLRHAIERLAPQIRLEKHSAIYRTMPMYVKEQPEFLNMTIQAETELSAHEVFQKIDTIQKEMGEHRKNQPRSIDIDILFFGHKIIETPELKIPHPKIAERAFVLVPMNDIAPDFVHPVLGVQIETLLSRVEGHEDVKPFSHSYE